MPDFGLTYMRVCLFGYRAATATETPPSLDLLGQWRMKRLTGRLAHGCWDCVHLVPSELRVTTLSSSSKRSTKLHVAGACSSPGLFACMLGRLSVSTTLNVERSARPLSGPGHMRPSPPHHDDAAWAVGQQARGRPKGPSGPIPYQTRHAHERAGRFQCHASWQIVDFAVTSNHVGRGCF